MNGEEQADAMRPVDKQSEGNGAIPDATPNAKPGSHWDSQLYEMCMHWMHVALALLQSKPVVMAPEYDVVLADGGYSTTLGPNRPDLRQTVDAYAGDLTSQAEFLELAQLIFGTPDLAAGLLLFVTVKALLAAARDFFDRYNQCPDAVRSIIGAHPAKAV